MYLPQITTLIKKEKRKKITSKCTYAGSCEKFNVPALCLFCIAIKLENIQSKTEFRMVTQGIPVSHISYILKKLFFCSRAI